MLMLVWSKSSRVTEYLYLEEEEEEEKTANPINKAVQRVQVIYVSLHLAFYRNILLSPVLSPSLHKNRMAGPNVQRLCP
jgi:hypothetical protein